MAASFLHGVETIRDESGSKPITVVKSAVIGVVGLAPIYELDADDQTLNELKLITSDVDAARYAGSALSGYTLRQALNGIFDQAEDGSGVGVIHMVNVFDPATHKSSVEGEEHAFDEDDLIDVGHPGLSGLVVKNQAGDTTYVLDTDYSADLVKGQITRIDGGNIAAEATVALTYDYADPGRVSAADIIGTVDDGGNRTGMQVFKDAHNEFGYSPRIIIAPGFSSTDSVATELDVIAHSIRAHAIVDVPVGTSVQDAIAGRGPDGTINLNHSSRRMYGVYPHLKVYDLETEAEVLEPYSVRAAGVWSASILKNGYWWSPSNKEIKGITGTEIKLSASINDASCEVNQLNEAGITTVFNTFGSGRRTWGNRSLAWPSESGPETFVAVGMTADVIEDSIDFFSLQFADRPIDDAFITSVVESVRAFLRELMGKGAIIGGNCWYDPAHNTKEELEKGHIVFDYDFFSPVPAERTTYRNRINNTYLVELGGK